jgi:DNA-binding MarR family transcriptional regulator
MDYGMIAARVSNLRPEAVVALMCIKEFDNRIGINELGKHLQVSPNYAGELVYSLVERNLAALNEGVLHALV